MTDLAEPDFVPSRDECFRMFLALLPSGRAWQTHDAAISSTVLDGAGNVLSTLPNSVLRAFWLGIATVWAEFEAAQAAVLAEYSAATSVTDLDGWRAEYDTGDALDPYGGDIVAKASDVGGHSFAYYRDLVALSGWTISGRWIPDQSKLFVRVHAADSPAVARKIRLNGAPRFGRLRLAPTVVNTNRLQSMLDRIVPAHAVIQIEVV